MKEYQSQPDLLEELKKIGQKEEAKVIIPAAFLAFAALDAVPIPTDIGYFYAEKYLEDHKAAFKHYWGLKALNYYGWDVLWYLTLFGLTYKLGKTALDKVKIGAGIIGTGAIIALLWKFTEKHQQTTIEAPVAEGEIMGLAAIAI